MNKVSANADYAIKFINQTNKSVFITGKAGTGKTTLLKEIIAKTHKNKAVVAPTGIAALNANGVTIHSFFQLPFGGFIPDFVDPQFSSSIKFESKNTLKRHFKMSFQRKSVINNLDLLIIDEVSMLRADLLDAIDFVLQNCRKNELPFGGVQVVFIGDLLQLPPIVSKEEWHVLQHYYKDKFFFNAIVLQNNPPLFIELDIIYRQNDLVFINLLNNLRNNSMTQEDLNFINKFEQPNFDFKKNKGYITLTSHNEKADKINADSLDHLETNEVVFEAEIIDDFPEKIYPIDRFLSLKVGAQVMFIKNDLSIDKNFYNGKMGIVTKLSSKELYVTFDDENKTIEVEKQEWQNIKYNLNPNTKDIEEQVLGSFTQYPIKLAWAITIHKSQGLTFERAVLDVAQVFQPGQAYVAFSRIRSLKGLVLLSKMKTSQLDTDKEIVRYSSRKTLESDLEKALKNESKIFLLKRIIESFQWKNLIESWRNHELSYNQESRKSIKSKHRKWAQDCVIKVEKTIITAEKFIVQIKSLFARECFDLIFINERFNKAFEYFYTDLDDLVFQILLKIDEISKTKNTKAFYNELLEIEEIQTKTVLNLIKTKNILKNALLNKDLEKENLYTNEVLEYKIKKIQLVQKFRVNEPVLIENEPIIKKQKAQKKSKTNQTTYDITLELWKKKLKMEEIALERKFSIQTICSHFAKLIEYQMIKIEEVVPHQKLNALEKSFKAFNGETLSELKEKTGEQFTWNDLKLYRAHLALNK